MFINFSLASKHTRIAQHNHGCPDLLIFFLFFHKIYFISSKISQINKVEEIQDIWGNFCSSLQAGKPLLQLPVPPHLSPPGENGKETIPPQPSQPAEENLPPLLTLARIPPCTCNRQREATCPGDQSYTPQCLLSWKNIS